MHSIAPWETDTVIAAWAQAAARRELRDAVDALDAVRAAMIGLGADTGWHSDGVRALQESLDDLQWRTGAVAASVRLREVEVAGVALP